MGKMKFGEKAKNPKKTFLRLMKDVFEGRYFLIVLIVLAPCKRQNTGEHSHAENNRYKLFHLFSLS